MDSDRVFEGKQKRPKCLFFIHYDCFITKRLEGGKSDIQ